MVTPAVLGAVVGTALALVITLTLLIYRYHVRKYDDWTTWERRRPATFKSIKSERPKLNSQMTKPTYLPIIPQSFTADPVQPVAALNAPTRVAMSSSNDAGARPGARPGASGGAESKHSSSCSSPLSNFSLDIPTSIWSSSHLTTLPHQSYSVPFVPHLIRTYSTHEKPTPVKPRSESLSGELSLSSRISISAPTPSHQMRTPSPIRQRLSTSPATTFSGSANNNPNLTPYPSPLMSPAPSFTSLLTASMDRSTSNSPTPLTRMERNRCRSPMLSLTKINSSLSSSSTQSQGSTTSLSILTPTISTTSAHTPLGTLQPELYKRETSIVLGVYNNSSSDKEDELTNQGAASSKGTSPSAFLFLDPVRTTRNGRNSVSAIGRLHFRLSYDFNKSDLVLQLIEGRDLASAISDWKDSKCGSISGSRASIKEAHVRISLVPEVDQRHRQSVLRFSDGVHCHFDEFFKFPVSYDDLRDKTLRFQICDYDRFSRPCVIGDLTFSLADCDITSSLDIWGEVIKNILPDETRPQLLISLSYLPSAERLTVVVLKAKNLVVPANRESINPLVKLYLMVNDKRVKKKKTESRKATVNPVWNQALTFTVPSPKLHSCTLEISVVDQNCDRGGKSTQLGCVVVGPGQNQAERQHWQDMAHNVRKSIAMWHFLY